MAQIIFVSRKEWGASEATETFIRNRVRNRAENVTSIHVHHTAAIDTNDSTPNRWDKDEAIAYMRKLQHSRPDLGPLPYNDNIAISEDLQTVWLFEGRGPLVRGAHTAGYNTTGYGIGILGNFDKNNPEAAKVLLWAIERRVYDLRTKHGLVNLGSKKSPKGWNAWGHRDSSAKSCPGNHFYPLLADFRLVDFEDEGDDMIRELTKGLTPRNIDRLFDAGIIHGDRNYWKDLLSKPEDPHWNRFWAEVFVQSAVQAGGVSEARVKEIVATTRLDPR